ncbi:hypothetical protein [Gracilimonas sp.]|uniref:hypothetical protein n=1 Tax=Gracilimonas sp. TaxID=1974203 RepID=UPI0032EB584F
MNKCYMLIAALLLFVAGCSTSTNCDLRIESRFITYTESEEEPYVSIFLDVRSGNSFLVRFESSDKRATYYEHEGVLCLKETNDVFYEIK